MTEKGKFSPHALPVSGRSPSRDLGCLLALAGRYKPRQGSPFWGCLQSLRGATKSQSRAHHLLRTGRVIHSHKDTEELKNKAERVYTEKAERLEL